jgi:hypothetical protein
MPIHTVNQGGVPFHFLRRGMASPEAVNQKSKPRTLITLTDVITSRSCVLKTVGRASAKVNGAGKHLDSLHFVYVTLGQLLIPP